MMDISLKRIFEPVAYAVGLAGFVFAMAAGQQRTPAQDEREFACIQNSDERKCRCWVFKKNCPDIHALCMADGNTRAQCDCWVNNACPQDYDPKVPS